MTITPYYIIFLDFSLLSYIYTLSLHDALPIFSFYIICVFSPLFGIISLRINVSSILQKSLILISIKHLIGLFYFIIRSEEHTSELQSPVHIVCSLLLVKKNIHQFTLLNYL